MSELKKSLDQGKFTITAEVCPPRGTNVDDFIEKANLLKGKVVAANVTDNQRAVMRLSSLAASKVLVDNGIEPVFQMTCRDRNRLALQSDIMGAWTLGSRNILCLTGDPVDVGDHRTAKPVFDLDAVELVKTVSTLNEGKSLRGMALRGKTDFYIGAVVTPDADPFEHEWDRFKNKINAGAKFFQTQAIYNMDTFKSFFEKSQKEFPDVKILAGILLVKSAKMAVFLNKNVPGVIVPDSIIDELEEYEVEDQLQIGIDIANRQVKELRTFCHGAHIMAMSQEESVPQIIAE